MPFRAGFGKQVEPDVIVMTSCMNALVSGGKWSEALSLLDEMRSRKIVPNERTYKVRGRMNAFFGFRNISQNSNYFVRCSLMLLASFIVNVQRNGVHQIVYYIGSYSYNII